MSAGDDLSRLVSTPLAQAGWKSVMTLLTVLALLLGYLVNEKLSDLKQLTASVQELSRAIGDVRSDLRVTGVTMTDHEKRIEKLEDWRNVRKNP